MWNDEPTPDERKEMAAQVDWFGDTLSSKEDIASDLIDPRYPLVGPLRPMADWCDAVDTASWNNRDWALGLWHVLLGQVLRNQRIRVGAEHFDGRFHLLILAPSGSGKTRAANQARRALAKVQVWEADSAVAGGYRAVPLEVRPMVEATTAALVGGTTTQGKLKVPTPGLLETADLIHWDEAEAMFHETTYNANMLRVMNMAMNPIGTPGNMVVKELSGVSNVVNPKCSLLMTAVDFLAIPEQLLRNGFFQRIGVMRKTLTPEQRRANRRREKQIIDQDLSVERQLDSTLNYLSDLALEYRLPQHWKFSRVSGMMLNKYDKMLEAAGKNEQVRPYLEDFAERYMDKLYILSMHYAAMRTKGTSSINASTDRTVEIEDVARAWVVVKTCMKQFFFYVMEIAHMWKYAGEKKARQRFLSGQGLGP